MDISDHDEINFGDVDVIIELKRTLSCSRQRVNELQYFIETVNLNRFNSIFKEPLRLPFSVQQ